MFVLQWEYKKDFEENKGMYHFDAEATEHLHHKGNATLQSQVSPRVLLPQTSTTMGLPAAQCHALGRVEPENINFASGKKFLIFLSFGSGSWNHVST